MLILSLLAIFCLGPSSLTDESTPVTILYVIGDATPIRAEPDAKAKTVAKLQRYDVVSGKEVGPGWLQIEGTTSASAATSGWIPLVTENVVRGPLENLKLRLFRIQQTKWADGVKLDIVRGIVRPGFTGQQVQLALGDPMKKELRHVGGDVAEEWTYRERRILFNHTGVQTIEPLQYP